MTGANTVATLSGLFKEVYADKINQLVPDGVKFMKMVDFVESSKENGNLYHQPVLLTLEHGVTYAGPNSGAFSLGNAIAAQMQDAQIAGSQILLRSALSYEAAARASTSTKAFAKATQLLVENMLNSISKRLEIALIYGQSPTGIGQATSGTNVSSTSETIQISTATWASGIWSGAEGAVLVAYTASNNTRLNTSDTVGYTVTAVSLVNRTVTVSGSSGDITALDGNLSTAVATNFYFLSAVSGSTSGFAYAEFAGLDKIVTNVGSLFNINAAAYALWAGNSYSAGSAELNLAKVLNAVAFAVERGLDEEVVVLVSPKTWANLSNDQAALRMYDSSFKGGQFENGAEKLLYHGQNGKIVIESSIYIKEGEAFICPIKHLKRIGAMEIGFKLPGRQEQEAFFLELATGAGYELRCYTDQALFCDAPAKLVKITSIVNSD